MGAIQDSLYSILAVGVLLIFGSLLARRFRDRRSRARKGRSGAGGAPSPACSPRLDG
jgi:hypothetical protein